MPLLETFYAEIKNDSNGTRTWSYNLENTYGNSTREIFVFPKLESSSTLLSKLQDYSVELRLNIKWSGTGQHEIADKNQNNTNQVEKQKLHILSNLYLHFMNTHRRFQNVVYGLFILNRALGITQSRFVISFLK